VSAPPPLVVRADASTAIGIGHIMRSVALAEAYADQGGQVTVLGRIEQQPLVAQLLDQRFDYVPLTAVHPDPSDLAVVLPFVEATGCCTVLDGYHFDPQYQHAVRSAGCGLLVIDDDAQWPRYEADVVLNQNLGADTLSYGCDPSARLLLGPHYALLRQGFVRQERPLRNLQNVPARARRVLVTLGGGDPDNVTHDVVDAFRLLDRPEMDVRFVVGPANPWKDDLRKAIEALTCSATIVSRGQDMPALMRWADMAIAAGGSSNWEFCYMGVPAVVMVLAQNQHRIADQLAAAGVAMNLGRHDAVDAVQLAKAVTELADDPAARYEMIERGQALVDGKGSRRVAETLVQLSADRARCHQ
jgi:UDP-2,4-diacetamido-2,4,6-trideoxy-beta-L-altropyranose hydrolase